MTPVLALLALQCTLCWTIKVPVEWNDKSEVQNGQFSDQNNETTIQTFTPHSVERPTIPKEYFEYKAKKPQFATDISAFHGVKSPEQHYKAYPVRPYTSVKKPELGKHNIFENKKPAFEPYRKFVKNNEHLGYVTPASSNYNIFHPYGAEEPALKAIYQDPVLDKIRNDLKDSQYRLQKYEKDAGESNIEKEEYLESPEQTDRKKFPHRQTLAPFEIHRPQRRPVYYLPPARYGNRDYILNHKIRHPWNQNYVKVTPYHYLPIKNHLHQLRQQHALKYDDENNEYPQIQLPLGYDDKPDGYDIYEKGKEKFTQLRNNVDESISNAVNKNSPSTHKKLELQNIDKTEESTSDDYEFLPVKNYAQVRKIETVKHLPRTAAFEDAESYEDLKNAPHLREAIKSTKAQTVYSEEGYEDSAYDHAGEQKHASDHEGHGGYLKEKELSQGKYKIPTFSGNYEDEKGSSYRDKAYHGGKWKNDDKETERQKDEEDYSEDDQEYFNESDLNENTPKGESSNENEKVDYEPKNQFESTENHNSDSQHDLSKREVNIRVPNINLNTTFLNNDAIVNISLTKLHPVEFMNLTKKYPYYNKSEINKESPLRYAENLKNIPKKTKGGTEFYDSRTRYECPEVENDVDPVPEKLKKGENPGEVDDDNVNQNDKPVLKGLGDKIDCFKIKYFGENPLDSPFFEEDLISNPEPVTAPPSSVFKLFGNKDGHTLPSQINSFILKPESSNETYKLIEIDRNSKELFQPEGIISDLLSTNWSRDIPVNKKIPLPNQLNFDMSILKKPNKAESSTRRKRAAPFIYEPYKIIRDSQIQDSKKTTTTSNISPLIKQLQSSRVVDRVATNMNKDHPVKRNTGSLAYKNIGKKDREKAENESSHLTFIDVNADTRQMEPRFEPRPTNHKPHYTPVENKNSMSLETYKNRTNFKNVNDKKITNLSTKSTNGQLNTEFHRRPFFDLSKYLPLSPEIQIPEPSIKVQNIKKMKEPVEELSSSSPAAPINEESDEEYHDYDEEEDDFPKTTTTTTTLKPQIRKKIRILTTTSQPENKDDLDKLRLVTRFRNPSTIDQSPTKKEKPRDDLDSKNKNTEKEELEASPKYREKKKKSSKSTLVTDSSSYGEGEDDTMRNKEVDELIGIQHDMEDYMPLYEKERQMINNNSRSLKDKSGYLEKKKNKSEENEEEMDDEVSSESEDDDNDKDEDDDDDDDDNENNDDSEEEDEDNDEDDEENGEESDNIDHKYPLTTPEPLKGILMKTTEAPEITTKVHVTKSDVKPIISRKKIEIHKELPYQKSSPNVTQFKQDIKEIEIVKEIPSGKMMHNSSLQKDPEILQLYKDENLAKEVNGYFDVEVFKDDLDLKKSPRHGGNYRSIKAAKTNIHRNESPNVSKKDSISSQSQTKKLIEPTSDRASNDRSMRIRNIYQRSKKSRGQNTKPDRYSHREEGSEKDQKSAKLIELSEDDDHKDVESEPENMHGGNFKTYSNSKSSGNPMHGGNYRSARIILSDKHDNQVSQNKMKERNEDASKNVRKSSAALLDSFARAVPILTTTPAYILDPSKRMYYYVDS